MKIKPWKTLSSETAFKNAWWHIKRETVELPDGTTYGDFFVNDKPGGAVTFALTEDGLVVVNRQYKHGSGEIVTELAVGAFAGDDEPPMEVAKRELLEETGYGGGSWEPLGVLIPNPTSSRARIHAFLARDVKKIAEPQADPRETVEVDLVDPADLPSMVADGVITSSAAVSTIFLALMRLEAETVA